MAGDAVFEATGAAGVGGDVAAEAAFFEGGGIGWVEPAFFAGGGLEGGGDDAGLDDGDSVCGVEFEDLVEAHQVEGDAAVEGDGAADVADAGALGGDGDLMGVGVAEDFGDFSGVVGADDDGGWGGGEPFVGAVGGDVGGGGGDAVGADEGGEGGGEVGHGEKGRLDFDAAGEVEFGVGGWGPGLELVDEVIDVGGGDDAVAVLSGEEGGGDEVVEEGEEGIEEAVDVEEADGVLVDTQLGPGEDFEEFVEGAVAAGEGDEGLAFFDHEELALVHGGGDVEVGEVGVFELAGVEEGGDDAGDVSAGGEGGIGDGAHHADTAAAVDEADLAVGEGLAGLDGGLDEAGVVAGAGAAVDGEGVDEGHWGRGEHSIANEECPMGRGSHEGTKARRGGER